MDILFFYCIESCNNLLGYFLTLINMKIFLFTYGCVYVKLKTRMRNCQSKSNETHQKSAPKKNLPFPIVSCSVWSKGFYFRLIFPRNKLGPIQYMKIILEFLGPLVPWLGSKFTEQPVCRKNVALNIGTGSWLKKIKRKTIVNQVNK